MIVPAGKRREQVNQGELRNKNFFEHDLFEKFAQGIESLVDDPVNMHQPEQSLNSAPPSDIQETMNSGGLDHDRQADALENQRNAPGLTSPASRFLGQNQDTQSQNDPNAIWQMERKKIRSFIGNDFGMKLQQGTDGSFTVTLTPPQGAPVQDPSGFMDALLQHIGGASVNEETTPALTDAGGNLSLKYRPSGSAPEKIRPRGKRR